MPFNQPHRRRNEELVQLARQHNVKLQFASKSQLDDLCQGRPHHNVALQVEPLQVETVQEPISPFTTGLALLLADIIDPQNLGSIIRSAAFFGVSQVYLTRGCAALSPAVSKASAGSLEWYCRRMRRCQRGPPFIQSALHLKHRVIAATSGSLTPSKSIWETHLNDMPTILVLGNEGSGIPKSILEKCPESITIPANEQNMGLDSLNLDSLNVGVATAILVSHFMGSPK